MLTPESYTDLLHRDPSERLAWLANLVDSPFKDVARRSDNWDDGVYEIYVRNLGEWLASFTVLHGEPVLDNNEVLTAVLTEAGRRGSSDDLRFMDDELAISHAAKVYNVCVTEFETCLE